MSVWKRNAVVLAIVLFVGVAVYLNWSYNNQSAATDGKPAASSEPGKTLGQTTLVNGTDGDTAAEGDGTQTDATAQTGYFAAARLNRQQARDSALELLQKAAADKSAAQSAVDEANAAIQTMAAYTMSEAQMENLVIAKGYGECVCFLDEDRVSVVVSATAEGLGEADIAKILEIVMEETGLTAEQITITEAQP